MFKSVVEPFVISLCNEIQACGFLAKYVQTIVGIDIQWFCRTVTLSEIITAMTPLSDRLTGFGQHGLGRNKNYFQCNYV